MKTKMKHFPATNPNPVLSVAKNGTVLYSNEAGEPLLREWGIAVREKLPSDIEDIVQEVISRNSPEKMEVKAGNKIYFVSFHPLPEEECVNIYGFDISDLKEIEGKLRESEEKYRDIIETAIEGIWILDAEFRTSYVNKKMAEILGYNQEEMIDRFPWDFADEEDKNIIKLNMEKRLQGISEILEIKYIRSDGSPLWAQVSSKSLFDENGKFTGVLGMLTDITERKQAADELRLNEANLVKAQSITHLGNWSWDVKGDRIVGSLEFLRMFCFEHLDCIAYTDFIARVHPEDRELVNVAVQAALFDKIPYSIDYRILLSEGVERFIHAEGEVTRNKTGHPVTMFGTVQDITERKLAEEVLRASEEQLRLSLDSSDAGMWEWDLGTNRNVWSEEIWRLYGLQPHCCEPTYEVWRATIHPDDRDMAERTVLEAARDGTEINFEYRVLDDGGKVSWLMSRGRPFINSDGKSVRYIGIVVDITERKKVEEALNEAYEKLQIQSEELQVSNEELRVQSDELNEANSLLHDRVTGFRTLAENSPDLIARFDRQGRCLYTNPACEEFYDIPQLIQFYGLSINDLIKKPDYVIQIDPELMKLSEKQRKNAITTGKSETTVFHYVSPKGKKYWFDTKVMPEFVNNEVVSVLVISRDITIMKEAEAKLKETLGNLEEKVTERTSELEEAYKLSLENERRFN
jgi:PAS domain S-box-containing protein